MEMYIIFYLVVFLIIFMIDYFVVLKPHLKGKKKNKKIMEVDYLVLRFKLDRNKLIKRWIFLYFALFNACIISVVSTVVSFVPIDLIWQLLIGFALLFGLIYSLYEIFGRYLVKKGLK